MYLVDTNIFLEFLLGQSRTNEAIELFHKIISGHIEANVSRFSLYSIEIMLGNQNKIEELTKFLVIIKHARGLKIINSDLNDDERIVELMKKYNLDFDDALHYYFCKTQNLQIISFDRHFDKTDIKRVEPSDIK